MTQSFARSSVPMCVDRCNPDAGTPQDIVRSGFYAGVYRAVGDAMSTNCEFGRVLHLSPHSRVNCFTFHAENSLRAASVSKVTFSSQSPLAPGAWQRAPFFEVSHEVS